MKEHGPWKIIGPCEVYRDPWLALIKDEVIRPDGQAGHFGVVHVVSGVCVLPLDEEGFVYLAEEFRYAVGRKSLEAVGGAIDEGEEPLAAARRELQEELGIEAIDWTDLGTVDPYTSMVLGPVRLFLARGLRHGTPTPDSTEFIRCVKMPLTEAIHAVMESRITHGSTQVLILKVAQGGA